MICPYCGRENVSDGLFCSYCAARLPVQTDPVIGKSDDEKTMIIKEDEYDDEKTVIIKDDEPDDEKTVIIKDDEFGDEEEATVIISDDDTYVPSFAYSRQDKKTVQESGSKDHIVSYQSNAVYDKRQTGTERPEWSSSASDDAQVARLKQLFDDGILTKEEYERKLSTLTGRPVISDNNSSESEVTAAPVIERPSAEKAQKYCSGCGAKLEKGLSFCTQCGTRVAGSQPANESDKSQSLFDSVQKSVQSVIRAEDSRPVTHEYQNLGGWLAVIAYGNLIGAALMLVRLIMNLSDLSAVKSMTFGYAGGITSTIAVFLVIFYAAAIAAALGFFMMIQRKNSGFLLYYEVVMLAAAGLVILAGIIAGMSVSSMLGSFAGFATGKLFGRVVGYVLCIAIALAIGLSYFSKSVRVRTYFGTDEYLLKSIFCKNIKAPEPAVPDRI